MYKKKYLKYKTKYLDFKSQLGGTFGESEVPDPPPLSDDYIIDENGIPRLIEKNQEIVAYSNDSEIKTRIRELIEKSKEKTIDLRLFDTITREGLQIIAKNINLLNIVTLWIELNIGNSAIDEIVEIMNSKTLRILYLIDCNITRWKEIAHALATNIKIIYLNLSGNRVDIGPITNALRTNNTLKCLDLSAKIFSPKYSRTIDKEFIELARALFNKEQQTLETLILDNLHLNNKVYYVFVKNQILKHFYFRNNELTGLPLNVGSYGITTIYRL